MKRTLTALGLAACLAACSPPPAEAPAQALQQLHADLAALHASTPRLTADQLLEWARARPDLPTALEAIPTRAAPPQKSGLTTAATSDFCAETGSDLADAFFYQDWATFDSAMSLLNTYC